MTFPREWEGSDFYVLLGLSRDASPEKVKSEYQWNARKFHPDVNGGDLRATERFRQIQLAYEVLSNPESRGKYDRFLGHGQTSGTNSRSQHSKPSSNVRKAPNGESDFNQASSTKGNSALVITSILIGVLLLIGLFAGGSINFFTDESVQNDASQINPAPAPVEVNPVTPVPVSKYTVNDIQACEDFRSFDHNEVYGVPANASEQREIFNDLSLDYSRFFYLADDEELIRLSGGLSRAAGFIAQMVGEPDEGVWGMITTGFEDAYGRLWAVCGEVG